ncbi:MAG: ectonucleotide pyrophosphatase/phosphodiesterase [Planctomycetaceae bacterium]
MTLHATWALAVPLIAMLCIVSLNSGCSQSHTESASASLEAVATAAPSAAADSAPEIPRPPTLVPRPVPAIDRVLIISVDGLRPDLLLRGEMPRVRGLCKTGSFSFWAETTPEAYTLPCHVSMLTGTPSEKHGVTWNEYMEESYSNVPTLFEVAKQAGFSTAMVAGKMKFIVFLKPNTVDHFYLPPDEPVTDWAVAERAESILHQHQPQVMFIHLPSVDTIGHEFGWGSPEQMAAIAQADEAVGLVLDALADLKLIDSTLIILTADHGGAEKSHDTDDPRSHFIPWIVSGPSLHQDYDLTRTNRKTIRTEDTFATACAFLGIQPADEVLGKPVFEILAGLPEE